MADDQKIFLTVIGPEELIRSLSSMETSGEFSVSEPRPVDSLVDAVDAVLGPDDIKQLLEFVTVVLKFGTETFAFIAALKVLLASVHTASKLEVKILDARTNKEILVVNENTDAAVAKKAIEAPPIT
jgi:hypothetical protein